MSYKPSHLTVYFYITSKMSIGRSYYRVGHHHDNIRVYIGNCFQTKDEAFNTLMKIRNLLKIPSNTPLFERREDQ